MIYIILNWNGMTEIEETIAVVTKKDGNAMLFDSERKAENYAKKNLNFEWKVVEI